MMIKAKKADEFHDVKSKSGIKQLTVFGETQNKFDI